MNCKYYKTRTKKYNKYGYCIKYKKEVSLFCKGCEEIEYKEYKSINKRTTKKAKAEKDRFSLFTSNLNICIVCSKHKKHLHEVFFLVQIDRIRWDMVLLYLFALNVIVLYIMIVTYKICDILEGKRYLRNLSWFRFYFYFLKKYIISKIYIFTFSIFRFKFIKSIPYTITIYFIFKIIYILISFFTPFCIITSYEINIYITIFIIITSSITSC